MNNTWSLIPLSKIINSHSQPSRIIWTIFSITMVGGLIISIVFTVHQYLDHATVFRMDYSTSNYFNDLPAVTICHNNHRITKGYNLENNWNLAISYELPASLNVEWSTQNARSPLYQHMSNYTIQFKTDLTLGMRLTVVEQLPRPKDQICTIFELSLEKNKVWTSLDIVMYQENPRMNDYFEAVIHNKRSFPFNNYERYLYRRIDPGKMMYMFTAKSVANHLNTFRNPCANAWVDFLNINFSYDQTVCQWQQNCNNLDGHCHCSCELDIFGSLNNSCPGKCLHKYSRSLVNTTICPQACHKTKYSDLNVVTIDAHNKQESILTIIMSNLVSIATEEPIYTLAKMFSEIGGLSSLLFGVSSILLFELIEKILQSLSVLTSNPKQEKHKKYDNFSNDNIGNKKQKTELDDANIYSHSVEMIIDEITYSTVLTYTYTSAYAVGILS